MSDVMVAIVPSSAQPIADRQGRVTTWWQGFFNSLVAPAAPISAVTPGASPYSFVAGASGSVAVTGGTVTDISLKRNTTTVATGLTTGLIPVANGDVVIITYAVLPTVTFIPG